MSRLTRTHRLALIGGFAALLYLVGLGGPALWEPDEGRYAEVAREMVVSGDYVTPRDDGVRYLEKPPLVYWAGALAIRILGRNEFAVRLPAALASVGLVVVTAVAGELMLGPTVGLLGAIALGLSPLFFLFARTATPDPELAFFFSAALMAFYAAATCGDFHSGSSRRLMAAAAALLGLATLVKGPVALLLGGVIALLWLLGEGKAGAIMRIRWVECIALYLALTVPWFALAAQRNPGFLSFFFFHEHVQRFLNDTEHGWGPWFFLPIAIAGSWPFFYFAVFGISALQSPRGSDEAQSRSVVLRFLLLWFATVLIFFSLPRAKLAEYLLPGLPPLALLAAAGLEHLGTLKPQSAQRLLRNFGTINVVLGLATAVSFLVLRYHGALVSQQSADTAHLAVALASDGLLLVAILGIAGSVWWLHDRAPHHAPVMVALTALGIIGVLTKVRSDATVMFSYRMLARIIAPQIAQGCVLASYHHFIQSLPFYTGEQERLVGYRGELAPFSDSMDAAAAFVATDARLQNLWSSPAPCVVLVVNRKDLTKVSEMLKPAPGVLGCEGKKFALINRKPFTEVSQPIYCIQAAP